MNHRPAQADDAGARPGPGGVEPRRSFLALTLLGAAISASSYLLAVSRVTP